MSGYLGRENVLICFSIQVLARRIERFLGGGISVDIMPIHVFDPCETGKVLHKLGETFLALTERLFRLSTFCEVQGENDSLPEGVMHRRHLSPEVAFIGLSLEINAFACERTPQPLLHSFAALVRKDICDCTPFQHFTRESKSFGDRSFGDQIAKILIYYIDSAAGNAAGNGSVECFAGAHCGFHLLLLRQIVKVANHAKCAIR